MRSFAYNSRFADHLVVARCSIRQPAGLWALLVASFVLFSVSSWMISGFAAAPVTNTFTVSLAAALWIVVYLLSTAVVFGTPYLLTSTYILAMVVFHFGLIAQDGFGVIGVAQYRGNFGHWITLAGWYTNLALACIGIAFSVTSLNIRPAPSLSIEVARRLRTQNISRLRNLGVGLAFASMAFLAIGIAQVGNILRYDRLTLFFGGIDIRGLGLLSWTAPSAALALVLSAETAQQKGWCYAIGLVTLIIFLLSGNRSTAFFPLLLGVVLWVKTHHRIPMIGAIGMIVLTLLSIPIIGALRNETTYGSLTMDTIAESSSYASVSRALAELGGSAGVLAITLQSIPDDEPYRFGASYVGYLRNLIPNIGFSRDLSEDPLQIMQQSGTFSYGLRQLSPSRWASVKVYGVEVALYKNFGVGFSAVAEPYFNFGYWGVVGFFLLAGAFFARMEASNLIFNYHWLVFSTLFYWLLLMTVRNEFGNFTKPASFMLICLGIWLLVRRFTPFARP
jgi:oligosaccharide repeat unit polymerase